VEFFAPPVSIKFIPISQLASRKNVVPVFIHIKIYLINCLVLQCYFDLALYETIKVFQLRTFAIDFLTCYHIEENDEEKLLKNSIAKAFDRSLI